MKTQTPILCALFLIAAARLPAQSVPEYINYQGQLKAADGSPLATGNYTNEYNIYDQANGGVKVWGPFLFDGNGGTGHGLLVPVVNGNFNVIIGPKDTTGASITNAFSGPNRFIEIKVNGAAIVPRQQFLSTAYAFRTGTAANAEQLNQLPPTDYFLPPGMVVPFAGPTNKIPSGWLLCDGRSFLSNTYPRLAAAIGTAWGGSAGNFNLPDLRGMFLRGVNGDRTNPFADPDATNRVVQTTGGNAGNAVGSVQTGALQTHNHRWAHMEGASASTVWSWTNSTSAGFTNVLNWFPAGNASGTGTDDYFGISHNKAFDTFTDPASTILQASGETRPNNAYVNYIIKY